MPQRGLSLEAPRTPPRGLPLPRAVYYALALLQSASAAGAFFGYSSLARVLVLDGAFAGLCGGASGAPCSAQRERLSDLYSYAALLALTVPVVSGLLSDRLGPRFALRCFSTSFFAAAALLAYAAAARDDAAYVPGVLLLGASASSNLIPLFNVAELFPQRRSLALSVLSGSFDAGTLVFLVVAALFDAGVPLRTIFLGYACGPAALLVLLAVFVWRTSPFRSDDVAPTLQSAGPASSDTTTEVAAAPVDAAVAPAELAGRTGVAPALAPEAAKAAPAPAMPVAVPRLAITATPPPSKSRRPARGARLREPDTAEADEADEEAPETPLVVASPRRSQLVDQQVTATAEAAAPPAAEEKVAASAASAAVAAQAAEAASPAARFLPGVDVARLHALGFLEQIRQPEFYLFVCAFCIFNLRFQTYVATIGNFLDTLGDDGAFVRLFGAILPCGFFSVIAAGLLLDAHGPIPAFFVLSALCVLVSAASLVPLLAVQPIAFAAFAAFRGFLFSCMSAYLALVFGFKNLGLLVGSVTCIGGVFALQQVLWTRWATARGFAEPNAVLTLLACLTAFFPLWLRSRAN